MWAARAVDGTLGRACSAERGARLCFAPLAPLPPVQRTFPFCCSDNRYAIMLLCCGSLRVISYFPNAEMKACLT